MAATWSTDGEYIAFVRKVTDKEGGIPYYRVDTVHIATETVSEGIIPADEYDEEVTLKGWEWIGWSPTTNQLLLFHYDKPLHIADVLCDETTHICVADTRAVGVKPGRKYPLNAWSPDGTKMAYHCYTTTPTGDLIHEGICIQDTEGNMIQEFPETELGVEDIDFLAWAPDGTQIAFVAHPGDISDSRTDVFVLSLDDRSLINLTTDPSLNQSDPVWIP
jgi:dipeptidyl aminopeptidase/acylaminoacyl peptidase